MTFIGDAHYTKPNEFYVKAIYKNDCRWVHESTHKTRIGAMREVERMIKRGCYHAIGIEPHNTEFGIFQSHALQEVYNVRA